MSEATPPPRRILHLVIDGFPVAQLTGIAEASPTSATEIVPLTPANAPQALRQIFAADTVAIWSEL